MIEQASSSPEQDPSAQQWVEKLFSNRHADTIAAEKLNLLDIYSNATEHGRSVDEQLTRDQEDDVGVAAKNKLLGIIAELSDDPKVNVGDFIGLLDRQALELDNQHDETRYRQFKGLWDLLVAVAKDEELIEFFKSRPPDY